MNLYIMIDLIENQKLSDKNVKEIFDKCIKEYNSYSRNIALSILKMMGKRCMLSDEIFEKILYTRRYNDLFEGYFPLLHENEWEQNEYLTPEQKIRVELHYKTLKR